jgi:hypothetical protein
MRQRWLPSNAENPEYRAHSLLASAIFDIPMRRYGVDKAPQHFPWARLVAN